ncbi:MAG: site-2 protease family protein [Candidatus Roizmanbacteria bacterium]|nr:site-2 protease family protein [Candidatus Roizmanbacteria bacterium]MCX6732457.1 site-2 protease family protein [Candidatus Roizmanbacteria bacterium]
MIFSGSNPIIIIVGFIAIIIALSIHEAAHALAADKLGDPTPRLDGRITLNPLAHLDLSGLLFMLFFGFGWGKPVMFDPYNLKNPRRDAALISLAGPASNFILAICLSILMKTFNLFNLPLISTIGYVLIRTNIFLGIFNLLPIHPLDGFKVVGGILSPEQAIDWFQLQRYGMIFLLLLIIPLGSHSMLDTIMQPIQNFIVPLFVPSL